MKKIDLIIFPFHDYKKWINEGFRTRDAHLFENFKKDERIGNILVVNRPVSLAEIILKRSSWKTKNMDIKSSSRNHQLSQVSDNVFILDTLIPHFFRVAIEKKAWWNTSFNNNEVINNIRKSMKYIGMNNTCLLLQTPMAAGVVNKLGVDKVAFDAIDNWLHHPQMFKYKDIIQSNYELMEKHSNVIFTVSKDLKKLFNNNENVHWISNGVDVDYFKPSLKYENDYKNINIGYVGKIQERIDFKLVELCLNKFKNYKFTFCGPVLSCKDNVDKLVNKYKNIEFVGDIHYNDLPNKMKEFDITIIPHKVDKFTNSMNPLKLYEYIASGKQVISTGVAGINNISPYVYLSLNYDEFLINIEKSINILKHNDNLSIMVTNSLDENYTWKNKTHDIVKSMYELFN
ncbi:glycosyltransferase [[Clostridium] sordellii]|uniref:glycosyltransferase n=1 Tax=Paraclostridium sordellii TaxID=1505 RepID=UPI0005E12C5B|nr:glycosyltransferase [Paeniclostridium sordellii]CEP94201.1 glycosyltransferase [[Clostridium] sordellii] [Paeniclostridium sordellii]